MCYAFNIIRLVLQVKVKVDQTYPNRSNVGNDPKSARMERLSIERILIERRTSDGRSTLDIVSETMLTFG